VNEAEFRTCYFPLDDLKGIVFPRLGEMPLRKRKEAKEKGLSEPDSLWSVVVIRVGAPSP
jgi:hypothetical protein